MDVDLLRLDFVKRYSIFENKDSLYFESLQKLFKKYEGKPVSAQIAYKIAL